MLSWKGDDQFRRWMKESPKKATNALKGSLMLEGEVIMRKSKTIVPVDTGTLRGSGHVRQPEKDGSKVVVTLGFGGPASAYALYQHERDLNHPGQGQKKYLEQPANEAAAGFGERIGRRLERRLK